MRSDLRITRRHGEELETESSRKFDVHGGTQVSKELGWQELERPVCTLWC